MTDWKPQVGEKCLWMGAEVTVDAVDPMARVVFGDNSKDVAQLCDLRPLAPRVTCGCEDGPWEWDAELFAHRGGWQRGDCVVEVSDEITCTRCHYALKDGHAEPPAPESETIARLTQGNNALRQQNQRLRNHREQMEREIANLKRKVANAPALVPLEEEAVEMAVAAFDPIPCTWLCGTLAAHDGQLKHTHLNQDGRKALMDLIMARFGVAASPPAPQPAPEDVKQKAVEVIHPYLLGSPETQYDRAGCAVNALASSSLLAEHPAYKHLYAAVQEQYRELTVACNDALEVNAALKAENERVTAERDAARAKEASDRG